MSRVTIQKLVLAGSHFGHLTRRWNPKMKPFIFMEKNGIYVIDLQKTVKMLEDACDAVEKIVAQGDSVLFVGTKKQAKDIVKEHSTRCGMPFVNERWLGGMLTNFATIRKSIKKLELLEKKVVDGTYDALSKKERLSLDKQRDKLLRVMAGIRDMKRLPGAIFIVDTLEEEIAVREAKKLGIPVFAIVDTNSDPDPIDYPIPANDDAYKSIGLIIHTFTDAIIEGMAQLAAQKKDAAPPESSKQESEAKKRSGPRRRRSSKSPGKRTTGEKGTKRVEKEAVAASEKKDGE